MGESPWKFESSRPHHLVRGPLPDIQKPAGNRARNAQFPAGFLILVMGETISCAPGLAGLTGMIASILFFVGTYGVKAKPRFDFTALEGTQYLSRHGIACEVVEVPKGEAGIADTLLSAAQMRGCGLMVMGAYGHSRLAELLLGGVTRKMLVEPQMPILLAH